MSVPKTMDRMTVGDTLATYEFRVTPEFNRRYLEALEDPHPRYLSASGGRAVVHPGLLLNQSNCTRSPGFSLPSGMAAIHAREVTEFLHPAGVNTLLRVHFRIIDRYRKRDRDYVVVEAVIEDEDGTVIMRRRSANTFSRGGS